MKFYGITMQGKFVNHTLATVPATYNSPDDNGRLIYVEADGLLWWGDGDNLAWRSIGTGGGGDANEVEDMYSDLLRTTIFLNGTWDEYEDGVYIDNGNTTMTWDSDLRIWSYTAGQKLVTENLFDDLSNLSDVLTCMASVDYINTGGSEPAIRVSADGGVTWESTRSNGFHRFDTVGNDLRLEITANGSGYVRSHGILYNKDLSASCTRHALSFREFTSDGSTNIFNMQYTVDSILVFMNGDLLDGDDYAATDGETIVINAPTLQAGDIILVLTFGTSVAGGGDIDTSEFIRRDGSVTFIDNQPMGYNRIITMADGIASTDAATVGQITLDILKAIIMGTYTGNYYIEYTFNANDLPTNIDVWVDSGKSTVMANIVITFDVNDLPDTIVYTYSDSTGPQVVTQDYTFDAITELPTNMTQTTA